MNAEINEADEGLDAYRLIDAETIRKAIEHAFGEDD